MTYIIEEESGRYEGFVHEHNGYYAGDFVDTTEATPRWS